MAIAALVVSVLALVIAGASAFYARRQANDTAKLTAIESGRRHLERTPKFDPKIETVKGGGWHRLWLRLESPEPLDTIRVEIVNDRGVSFTTGQNGVDPSGASPRAAEYSSLRQGDNACWRVALEDDRPAILHMRVACKAGLDSWAVLLEVDVPYNIAKSIY